MNDTKHLHLPCKCIIIKNSPPSYEFYSIFFISYKYNSITLCKMQAYSMLKMFFLSPDNCALFTLWIRADASPDVGGSVSCIQFLHLFYFIRTPNFSPRLDVLIFSAISASKCSYDVLNYFTLKIKYLHSTTVYFILNITVFSLSYNMNWSWKECNRILYWPWQILTQTWKKDFSAENWGWACSDDVLKVFL